MNPAKLFICLWATLVSFTVFSQNCATSHLNEHLECSGNFVATSNEDISSYLTDLGINSNGTKIKNLKIDFNYNGPALNIYTPCKLILEDNRSITMNGDSCLIGKQETRIDSGANINATGNVRMESENVVVVQSGANVNIDGNFEMIATGSAGDARVNVRNNTTIDIGGDFLMKALRQAKVGYNVNASVGGAFTIISNGETLGSEDSDWSSISYDSVITAGDLSIASYERVNIGSNVTINTNSVYLDALDCKIRQGAVINSPTKTGNCFSGLHPTAKMKATPSAGDSPLEVFLSGDQSTVPNGVSIVAYHWEIVGVGTITTQIPTTYYTFSEVGMHKVRLQVEASNGLKNTVSKQIVIAGGDNQPPTASFLASSTDVLVGETVTLDASASTDDYKIKKYIWSASNGSSIVSRDPI